MKKSFMIALAVLGMVSCSERKFHVEGTVSEAADSVLYFENVGISDITVVDSVRLDADGHFSFSGEATPAPEFYRLRISDQIINVAIDSTETVRVSTAFPQMASRYDISGDDNQKIRELALLQQQLQQRAIAVSRDERLGIDASNDSILSMISQYKEDVKTRYIFPSPGKPHAYFALFQTLGNTLLFNPRSDAADITVFAAVATSWDTFWPDAERSKNLHNIAIEGMNNMRIVKAEQSKTIDASKVQLSGVIDLALQDNRGQERHLTDLKGKVVLLDFHMFGLKESPARILLLRELYNKYHQQGFEIFQVSLDKDEHFWKQQTDALPWVNVREPEGIDAPMLRVYNVRGLPEFFLIDRGNNLVSRSEQIKDLEQAIKNLL